MTQPPRPHYRLCATCRRPIGFEERLYRCSVSTCNRKRARLAFCSVPCWDAHQADARHRDAGAEEGTAPTAAEHAREQESERARSGGGAVAEGAPLPPVTGPWLHENLVVAARFKDYVMGRSGMSTSDRVFSVLSAELRDVCDAGILLARRDGRKTLLERDVEARAARGVESRATGTVDVDDRPGDVIVVVAKLKGYVKARAGMNTADAVPAVLSGVLRRMARQAIRRAGADDRRTILDRDLLPASR